MAIDEVLDLSAGLPTTDAAMQPLDSPQGTSGASCLESEQYPRPDATARRAQLVPVMIKADFTQPMRVEELAEQASMSPSSFHRHFKEVTSMSPLQYQKQLRLLEARRLMLAENFDAVNAAYQVGYESPSQFSREYARMFGAPPIKDIERLRTA